MSTLNTNPTLSNSVFHSVTSWASPLWLRFSQYRMYRKTLREMQRMSARELADFGLSRCDINRIARECVYGG